MKVAIVGGGMLGLTAAYELGKRGYQVSVYESGPVLGGQASTFNVGGARLERGYHHLFTSDVDVLSLIDELGLGPKMAWIPSKVGVFCNDRIYDFVTPTDLLKFSPLPFVDRIRLGIVALYLQRTKNWHKYERFTAKEWLAKYAGKKAYEIFWSPMLRGKFGDNADEIGMTWLWGKMFLRFASRKGMGKEVLGYPMGSFGEVIDSLEARIKVNGGEIHTATPVDRIVVKDGKAVGIEVVSLASKGGGSFQPADVVLGTTPSFILTKLVPELPEAEAEKLRRVRYHAAVLMILVLKHQLSPKYWLNISDRSVPFVGAIEHTNYIGPEHYNGKRIVYLSNYLSKQNPMYSMKPEELLAHYMPHLKRINPAFDASWIEEWHYHREEAAQPIITPNYSQQIPGVRTGIKGLYMANTTHVYPEDRGTNYAVRLGRRLTQLVLEDTGSRETLQMIPSAVADSFCTLAK